MSIGFLNVFSAVYHWDGLYIVKWSSLKIIFVHHKYLWSCPLYITFHNLKLSETTSSHLNLFLLILFSNSDCSISNVLMQILCKFVHEKFFRFKLNEHWFLITNQICTLFMNIVNTKVISKLCYLIKIDYCLQSFPCFKENENIFAVRYDINIFCPHFSCYNFSLGVKCSSRKNLMPLLSSLFLFPLKILIYDSEHFKHSSCSQKKS